MNNTPDSVRVFLTLSFVAFVAGVFVSYASPQICSKILGDVCTVKSEAGGFESQVVKTVFSDKPFEFCPDERWLHSYVRRFEVALLNLDTEIYNSPQGYYCWELEPACSRVRESAERQIKGLYLSPYE